MQLCVGDSGGLNVAVFELGTICVKMRMVPAIVTMHIRMDITQKRIFAVDINLTRTHRHFSHIH